MAFGVYNTRVAMDMIDEDGDDDDDNERVRLSTNLRLPTRRNAQRMETSVNG